MSRTLSSSSPHKQAHLWSQGELLERRLGSLGGPREPAALTSGSTPASLRGRRAERHTEQPSQEPPRGWHPPNRPHLNLTSCAAAPKAERSAGLQAADGRPRSLTQLSRSPWGEGLWGDGVGRQCAWRDVRAGCLQRNPHAISMGSRGEILHSNENDLSVPAKPGTELTDKTPY